MVNPVTLTPIGVVRSPIVKPVDDIWGGVKCRIELDASRFSPDCLVGLEEYSHVEILFHLNQLPEAAIVEGSRHPRGRTDWPKVGIFAQRAKNRPNRLGVTTCRLESVEGLSIVVEGLDAID